MSLIKREPCKLEPPLAKVKMEKPEEDAASQGQVAIAEDVESVDKKRKERDRRYELNRRVKRRSRRRGSVVH